MVSVIYMRLAAVKDQYLCMEDAGDKLQAPALWRHHTCRTSLTLPCHMAGATTAKHMPRVSYNLAYRASDND